jgi:hypothetical protein
MINSYLLNEQRPITTQFYAIALFKDSFAATEHKIVNAYVS